MHLAPLAPPNSSQQFNLGAFQEVPPNPDLDKEKKKKRKERKTPAMLHSVMVQENPKGKPQKNRLKMYKDCRS